MFLGRAAGLGECQSTALPQFEEGTGVIAGAERKIEIKIIGITGLNSSAT